MKSRAEHYPLIVALHAAWLAALWWLGAGPPDRHPIPLPCSSCLSSGRVWVIATLGERWTTRIIVVPGEPLVDVAAPIAGSTTPIIWS